MTIISRLTTYAIQLAQHRSDCCERYISFSGFKPAQDSTLIAGQFWGSNDRDHYYYYTITFDAFDLDGMKDDSLAISKIQYAYNEFIELLEGDCFTYWVKKTRREHGIPT